MAERLCPCSSGRRYVDCCAPYHRGEREAEDAVTLMRSRYSAFATKNAEYLWRTLHPDHDDRSREREGFLAEVRRACSGHRYTGLVILDEQEPDSEGVARVLFHAKVFERGRDLSFVELSDFAHDGTGWRYLSGVARPARDAGRTIATFR